MHYFALLFKNVKQKFCTLRHSSKHELNIDTSFFLMLQKPIKSKIDIHKLPPKTKIDSETISLLERLSLVDCANKRGIETLEASIQFADQILEVKTTNIEPLVTVLEDIPLRIRADKVTEGYCKDDILKNTKLVEEDYFVAPPGNIPLDVRNNPLYEEKQSTQ